MRIFQCKIIIGTLVLLLVSSLCNAQPKIKFTSKTLPQILDQYVKRGYSITGPVEITSITYEYLYLYKLGKIKKKKKIRIINKKGKRVSLHEGDWVYVIKKGKKMVLIKVPPRGIKNE